MTAHPKVSVFVEATDRTVNVIEERFDIAIRAKSAIEDVSGLVAKTLGNSQRVLVVKLSVLRFLNDVGARRIRPNCQNSTRSPAPMTYSTVERDGT